MLLILTGDVRTGKTTWLAERVAELNAAGVPVYGVLAPGVWNAAGEKVAIENALLPTRERVTLARPAAHGRSAAGLGWEFDPMAVRRVNAHLAALRHYADEGDARPGLLVIDELGPLELVRGAGLTEALASLEAGPAPAWPNAVVVVRRALADAAAARLRSAWGDVCLARPGEGATALLAHLADNPPAADA